MFNNCKKEMPWCTGVDGDTSRMCTDCLRERINKQYDAELTKKFEQLKKENNQLAKEVVKLNNDLKRTIIARDAITTFLVDALEKIKNLGDKDNG